MAESQIRSAYALAKERYAAFGVVTDVALRQLERVSISLHCSQGVDVERLPHSLDAVEPKRFGIGSESYVNGSMEFYTAYAVSRGVRWDSDHVVTFNDDLQAIAHEIVRAQALQPVHIGLDYFNASINRLAAWTVGARNTLRALLKALLEPRALLIQYEAEGDYSSRLALQEELKAMPSTRFGIITATPKTCRLGWLSWM